LNNAKTDGESGIQAKDVSCGVSIFQRELEPHSPSTTGRGSNQIMVESAYDLLIRNNASTGGNNSRVNVNNPLKINQHGSCLPVDMENRHGDLAAFDDFQGESQPTHFEGIILLIL